MEPITDSWRARRVARVLVSDLVAYAGDDIRMGLEKDDLFSRLGAEITRARIYYDQRVDRSLAEKDKIFNFALVDVLVFGNRRVPTHIW